MKMAIAILNKNRDIQRKLTQFSEMPEILDGIPKPETLARFLALGYVCALRSENEIECEVRINPDYRQFCGFETEEFIPAGAFISYSRKLYCHIDEAFEERVVSLLAMASGCLPNIRLAEPEKYLDSLDQHLTVPINPPAGAPIFLYDHKKGSSTFVCCSGGCVFHKKTEKRDECTPPDPDKPSSYQCTNVVLYPYTPSTLRTRTKERPDFPLGKVYGVRERFEVGPGDSEGGLRTKGIYKKNTPEQPLITYVTIVYNRVNVIKRCMESVWTQSYPNVEYIVVDGGSTDGTLEYIKKNADKIDYFISQKDNGLYDAMNKGVSFDWCTLHAAEIVARRFRETGADIISGLVSFNDGGKLTPARRKSFLFPNNTFIYPGYYHQGLYASRNAFETVGYFDEKLYPISDNKWTVLCVKKGLKFDMWDELVAVYTRGSGTATTDQYILSRAGYYNLAREIFHFLSKK